MDEEKTIDEAVEEQADEMKEFEPVAFDEVIKETEPERKDAPVLRALGDPDPADMNMIHKHLDNFLAKIAGETPIDENVRDSTEYWLNRIAENMPSGGGGTLYHYVIASSSGSNADYTQWCADIISNSDYKTPADLINGLYEKGIRYIPLNYIRTITGTQKIRFSTRAFFSSATSLLTSPDCELTFAGGSFTQTTGGAYSLPIPSDFVVKETISLS